MKLITVLVIIVLGIGNLRSQDNSENQKNSLKVLPIAFYTPETRIGGGFAGLYTFFNDYSKRPSSLNFGAAYTAEKQILSYMPFTVFWDSDQNYAYGEVGYYRYFFEYFGIGTAENNAADLENPEIYNVAFPRVRLNYLRRLGNSAWYLGGRYWFDGYAIDQEKLDQEGLIVQNQVLGIEGGITSSLGAVSIHESRDNLFYPTKGWYGEFVALYNGKYSGAEYDYGRFSADLSFYKSFGKEIDQTSANVFAFNVWSNNIIGDAPFYELSTIGGTKKMRGYYEGRYRDNQVFMVQTEYRRKIYKRFGVVAFGGLGSVFSKFELFEAPVRWNAGLGGRFRLNDQGANVRIDYGIGKESSGFYITIGEAF